MPIRVLFLFIGCVCTLAAIAAPAAAKPVLAELRVEGPQGTLDPGTFYVTDTERIRKSQPGDNCVRTSGSLTYEGPTALGIAQTGSEHNRKLRQVRVREDEAGPFVCEIGSITGRSFSDPLGFSGWSFWVNGVAGSSSADLVTLSKNDTVLWVFSDFGDAQLNTGSALELDGVPARDDDGVFEVSVTANSFDGSQGPADDVTIAGATQVTPLGAGRYEVTVPEGRTELFATRGSDIASNHVTACVAADPEECPAAHGRTIFGGAERDRIKGTKGWDRIDLGAGDDRIDIRSGGRDRVDCGAGKDTVLRKGSDDDDRLGKNCERVRSR